jgi:hypothetical protein
MSHTPITIVSAFFDINRSEKGDGRTIEEYLEWAKKTLQLNAHLYIITEPKFETFFRENRSSHLPFHLHIMDFTKSHYYSYYPQIQSILTSEEYQKRIKHPNRVECILPEYNILQYSKFHYLQLAIEENPFQSSHFFWMDLGASRFFMEVDISQPYPSENMSIQITQNPGFIIQYRRDLFYYPLDDNFVWDSTNLLCGTMFGGSAIVINIISQELEKIWKQKMIQQGAVNNEQLGLALVWKEYSEIFSLIPGDPSCHLILFSLLANEDATIFK